MVFQTELLLLRNVSQGPENTHIDLFAIKKVFSPNLMNLSARIIFIVVLITKQRILGVPMESRRFVGKPFGIRYGAPQPQKLTKCRQ
jgi:hypothetical protein